MSYRKARVEHEIQREVGELLEEEAHDPRLENVTVTQVKVTGDLRHAKIYFTYRDRDQTAEGQAALEHAAGFLRHALAKKLDLRFAPDLEFVPDQSLEKGEHLLSLLDEIHQQEEDKK